MYRIQNFPTAVTRNQAEKNTIPKILIRSKQYIEGIFTYLQAHPCYMITWINKLVTEPANIRPLVHMIYGKLEMQNNPRVINTLTIIAKSVFDKEFENYSLQAYAVLGDEESTFRTMFKIILESQA